MTLLTKSKYMAGLSCPKYLWMMFHDMDKIPEKDMDLITTDDGLKLTDAGKIAWL